MKIEGAEPFTATVGGLAHGGEFVCTVVNDHKVQSGKGWWTKKAFIRGVIPGERVLASVVEEEKSLLRAQLLKIIESSQDRCEAPCPIFGECGGCDLQYMNLTAQRSAKRDMVESMLERQAGVKPSAGVQLAGVDLPGFGYRTRIDLHLDSSGRLGFYRLSSGNVIPVNHCLIASDPINSALKQYCASISAAKKYVAGARIGINLDGKVEVILKLHDHCIAANLQEASLVDLCEMIPNLSVTIKEVPIYQQIDFVQVDSEVHGAHFSQVNLAGNQVLQKLVGDAVGIAPHVTELYAGSGNFSFLLASKGSHVDAVEADSVLAQLGNKTASARSLPVKFFAESCERFVKRNRLHSVVVLDPPRSGARAILHALAAPQVQKIVYVSCSVPTLARDLKELQSAGFLVVRTDIVDMFAQTHHVETVTILERTMLNHD